ncbi:TonB-dependent receptor [Colwellia sp. RE-S-Sl-9]
MIISKPTIKVSDISIAVALSVSTSFPALAELEIIEVRSTKRVESVQSVPIAMNTLSGEELVKNGVDDINDITTLFPNISVSSNSQVVAQYRIRGVGTSNFQSNAVSAVGLYYDEVVLPTPFSSSIGIYDLEQVEVLRGPQNTLFGRNTTGGAVNFISKKPDVGTGEVEGYSRLTVGSFDKRDFEGAVNIPLGDDWAARISMQSNNRGDVFKNLVAEQDDVGGIERHSGRIQLIWEPSDNTNLLFNIHSGVNRSDAGYGKANGIVDPNGGNCFENGLVTVLQLADFESENSCVTQISGPFGPGEQANTSTDDWRSLYSVSSNTGNIDIFGGFVKLKHNFNDMSFTSISSYDSTEVYFREDEGAAPFDTFHPTQDVEFDSYSQELRLQSDGDGPFRWMAGYYYFYDKSEQMVAATVALKSGSLEPLHTSLSAVVLEQKNTVNSLYGKFDYEFSPKWDLSFGLRWTDEEKEGDRTGIVTGPGVGTGNFGHDYTLNEVLAFDKVIRTDSNTLVNEKVGYNLMLTYQASRDVMLYGSMANGFKAGSFDIRALAITTWGTEDEQEVQPETLDSIEVGFKSLLLDRNLKLNVSYFMYDFHDLQVFAVQNGIPGLFNIPETELSGFDVEITYVPDPDWQINAGLGYLDSEIVDNGNISSFEEGGELSQSPKFTANMQIVRDIELDSGLIQLQATYRYVGERLSQLPDTGVGDLDSENWLNLRGSYIFGDDSQYELTLFVDNVTGVKSCSESQALSGPSGAGAGEPGPTWVVKCTPNEGEALWGISGSINF